MKNILTYIIISLLTLSMGISCSSKKYPASRNPEPIVLTKTITKKEVVRDTIFKTEKDSAFYKAYIECQSGKPILKNPKSKAGKHLKEPDVNLDKNGNLTVNVKSEAQKLFAQWREYHTAEQIPTVVYKDKEVYIDKPLKWYQRGLMWLGGISLAMFIIIGIAPIVFKSKL